MIRHVEFLQHGFLFKSTPLRKDEHKSKWNDKTEFVCLCKHSTESFFHYYVILKDPALPSAILQMWKMRNNHKTDRKNALLMTELEKYFSRPAVKLEVMTFDTGHSNLIPFSGAHSCFSNLPAPSLQTPCKQAMQAWKTSKKWKLQTVHLRFQEHKEKKKKRGYRTIPTCYACVLLPHIYDMQFLAVGDKELFWYELQISVGVFLYLFHPQTLLPRSAKPP